MTITPSIGSESDGERELCFKYKPDFYVCRILSHTVYFNKKLTYLKRADSSEMVIPSPLNY